MKEAEEEEEYDAVVTSICNESGKSDTEAFTVVGVDRLEYWKESEWVAMPEVLYVGLGETK